MTEREQDTLLCCTHGIIYCFTVHSLERWFWACLLLCLSFHPFVYLHPGIRGLTRDTLNIRGNQFGVFFLWEALKAEVEGSAAWSITPRLHCSKILQEICNRRHNNSRSSTDTSLTIRRSIKLIETKFSFRSLRVKTVSWGNIVTWENILSNNHYRFALAFCSSQSFLLAAVEEEKKKKRLLKDSLLKKTWTVVKQFPPWPPP